MTELTREQKRAHQRLLFEALIFTNDVRQACGQAPVDEEDSRVPFDKRVFRAPKNAPLDEWRDKRSQIVKKFCSLYGITKPSRAFVMRLVHIAPDDAALASVSAKRGMQSLPLAYWLEKQSGLILERQRGIIDAATEDGYMDSATRSKVLKAFKRPDKWQVRIETGASVSVRLYDYENGLIENVSAPAYAGLVVPDGCEIYHPKRTQHRRDTKTGGPLFPTRSFTDDDGVTFYARWAQLVEREG